MLKHIVRGDQNDIYLFHSSLTPNYNVSQNELTPTFRGSYFLNQASKWQKLTFIMKYDLLAKLSIKIKWFGSVVLMIYVIT